MKRRLRKKLHRGEFIQRGFHLFVLFELSGDAQADDFLDKYLTLAETHKFDSGGCSGAVCGLGFERAGLIDHYVTPGHVWQDITDAQVAELEAHLKALPEVLVVHVGEMTNIWAKPDVQKDDQMWAAARADFERKVSAYRREHDGAAPREAPAGA